MRHDNASLASLIFLTLIVCYLLSSCTSSIPPSSSTEGCTSWQIVASPNPGHVQDELESVFAATSNDVWAVGFFFGDPQQTLIEHWNGKTWSVVASDNPNTSGGELDAVAGSSASDVWAVGNQQGTGLIEHWNGSAWNVVHSPTPFLTSISLSGVAALSSTDAWAVGSSFSRAPSSTRSTNIALVEHWDGRIWSLVPSPDLRADLNGTELYNVAALASNDVWAVGSTSSSRQSQQALIEHWNGKAWSVVPSPQPQGTDITSAADLWGLAALSANNIWATGSLTVSGVTRYLIEHWDGHAWSVVPSPTPPDKLAILRRIAAVSANDIWALDNKGILAHWNGSVWSLTTFPNADQNGDAIKSIAALQDGKIWLVGSVNSPTGPGPRTLTATSCP